MQISHLHIGVRDIEVSGAFYKAHFGLVHHFHAGPILFLRDDAGMDFALSPAKADEAPWNGGLHFGFRLASREDVLVMHRRPRDAGVNEVYWE